MSTVCQQASLSCDLLNMLSSLCAVSSRRVSLCHSDSASQPNCCPLKLIPMSHLKQAFVHTAGELEANEGTVTKHPNLRVAYVAQHAFHHIEKHLDKTPNEYIQWRYAGGEDREEQEKVSRQVRLAAALSGHCAFVVGVMVLGLEG